MESTLTAAAAASATASAGPLRRLLTASPPGIEVVVPVHNEERVLGESVRLLHRRLTVACDVPFALTIADNASSDATSAIAQSLARELAGVRHLRLEQKGRGRALRAAWSASDAEVMAYMDVDLSTDLAHLPALFEPLLSRRSDLVVGSRLLPGARVTRGLRREVISRTYNAMLGFTLSAGFSDAQCGFKAVRREAIRVLLPMIEDEEWFFDTELLYLAQRNGFSIREIPVHWVDDSDSRVDIGRTIVGDLRGIGRLRRRTREGTDRLALPARVERVQSAQVALDLSQCIGDRRPSRPRGDARSFHRRTA